MDRSKTARAGLGAFDTESLSSHLEARGGTAAAARQTAARVLHHLHAQEAPPWGPSVLDDLRVGAWARAPLLELGWRPAWEVAAAIPSADGSTRLALRGRDGALVETVVIPSARRTTVCVSSQVGCARACTFCETGRHGYIRQLDAGEITDQVRIARAFTVRVEPDPGATPPSPQPAPPLRNIVFMGMGEPFDNLPSVLSAIRILTDPHAFGLAPKHVTVSTVGVADRIPTFFQSCRAELAVSLNAPDDRRRDLIMPVNRRTPLVDLRSVLLASLPPGRRVFFEYVLFDEFNDAPEDAELLERFVRGIPCRINVIPYNPSPGAPFRTPTPDRTRAFMTRLAELGVPTLLRRARGRDVGGACGQLAGAHRPSAAPL